VGAYGILCLIITCSLVDFRSLSPGAPAGSPAPHDEGLISDARWPHLRGPGYDGHSSETELADAWPAAGPPVLWTKEIGAGYSGVIAQGGRVYTQGQGLTEQKLFALDADTGRTVWEHGYTWPYQAAGMFPGPRATPTRVGGRIYFAAPNGVVGCVEAADGRAVWSVNVIQRFDGRGASFGYACSPVVEEGLVVLPVGGAAASVVALDAETGATRWAAGGAPASYCSAVPITFRGRRQVVVLLQNSVVGIDLKSGRLLWEQTFARGFDEHAAAVLYDEPYLRTMQAYRAGSDLFELEPGAPEEERDGVPGCRIRRVRRDAQMSNDVASSVLVGGFVYGFDLREMQASPGRPSRGTFRCMDFKTGEVRWSSEGPGQAQLVAADGKMLMLNDRGQALLVRADPRRYEELGRADVFPGETCWTAPALHRGRLYLRSPTRAACLFVGKAQRMSARQRAQASPLAGVARRAPGAEAVWLLGAEREYPFELPDLWELGRWYGFSLGALAAAGFAAGAVHGAVRRWSGRWRRWPAAVFWVGVVVLGVMVTRLANRHGGGFVFTWPVALLAVHQLALAGVLASRGAGRSERAEWVGVAGAGLLVAACLVYFKLTRQVNLAPAWYFLVIFPAAWPVAVPAARRVGRAGKLVGDVVWMGVVFSTYFWAAGGVMLWRTANM
jgi:outer membrane protein assembly factor BamB